MQLKKMAGSLVQLIKNLSIQPILTPLTLPQNSMKTQEPKIITTLTIPDKMENVSNPNVVDEKKEIVDMSVFSTTASGRGSNDRLNKSRENIICRLINDPTLETSVSSIKKSLYEYLSKLAPANFDFKNSLHSVRCMIKAGRKFNYDFEVNYLDSENIISTKCLEFKCNTETVAGCPQYVSPMKPSKYMSASYEDHFYRNYLPEICQMANCVIPDRETYISGIHQPSPSFMSQLQTLYYRGCKSSSKFTDNEKDISFYQACRMLSKKSIETFMNSGVQLKIEELSEYLFQSQKQKEYLLYSNGKFYHETPHMDDYTILDYTIRAPYFICNTKSGKKMKVLLRWKNGNGISFPAFQIS